MKKNGILKGKDLFFGILLFFAAVLFAWANDLAVIHFHRGFGENSIGVTLVSLSFFYRFFTSPKTWLFYLLMLFEAIVSYQAGLYALCFTLLAIGYSWLAYKEFFIGEWLKSQLLLRAVMRSVGIALLGYAVGVIKTEEPLWNLPGIYLLSGIINWNLCNLYQFTQNTYAVEEDNSRETNLTASTGAPKAVRLSLAQAFLATIFGELMIGQLMIGFFWGLLILFLWGAFFSYKATKERAQAFRVVSLAFIYYFYLIMIVLTVL